MIKVSYQDTLNDLKKFQDEVKRKLSNMVAGFAYEVSVIASSNTPEGSEGDLLAGLSGYGTKGQMKYAGAYQTRQKEYGIETSTGFHKGAWYYSKQGTLPFNPVIQTGQDAANNNYNDALGSYQIGESFYIVGIGPGFEALNDGSSLQAPDGILQPSMDQILQTYQINLQKYYREG